MKVFFGAGFALAVLAGCDSGTTGPSGSYAPHPRSEACRVEAIEGPGGSIQVVSSTPDANGNLTRAPTASEASCLGRAG